MALTLHHQPMPLELGDVSAFQRALAFLSHYDLRVYIQSHAYVDIGRGSLEALLRVQPVADDHRGLVGTIGQMCNFATDCALQGGGEHWNHLPVNVVFANVTALAAQAAVVPTLRPRPAEPFRIGHAVVVSAGARVLPGAEVGDGCVIGADALVTGVLPAFHICVGVPARALKPRVDETVAQRLAEVRWWDFDIAYLGNNIARLQELSVDTRARHAYRSARPRIVLRRHGWGAATELEPVGFVTESGERPLSDGPAKLREYLAQLNRTAPHYWLADAWAD